VAVRPTGPDELPGLAELFEERFGHPWTEEEWAWKYRNPLGGAAEPGGSEAARSWVAVKEGAGARVVAHAGALRFPARLGAGAEGSTGSRGSTRGGIWQLTDWMGSVGAGGLRPPLVTLGRALLADLPGPGDAPWIFGFPSERHLRLGRRTFGYRPLPEVKPLAGELAEAAEAAVAGGTKEPVRIIIDLKRDADPDIVLNQLYKFSPLQDSFSIILLALVDGKPRTLSL
jgi:hypothetical protein